MNCLIVGASAGLGRALAEEAARRGHHVLLLASDERDLAALAADLRLHHGIRAEYVACRLDPARDWWSVLRASVEKFGTIEGLFFPIGVVRDDDLGTLDDAAARQLVEVNWLGITRIVSHFWPEFTARGTGFIVGFGSIAAVRGRGSNVIYSAAKRALLSHFESMRHLAAQSDIRVQFYQLGYLDTQLAFGRRLLFPKCPPEQAAAYVFRNLNRDRGTVFYPRFWSLIALILRWTPWCLFKRLKF